GEKKENSSSPEKLENGPIEKKFSALDELLCSQPPQKVNLCWNQDALFCFPHI
ncbi:Hypothetical predicted protein, partial [Cloeon dipterum]